MAEEVKKAPKPVDPNSAKYKLGKIAADAYVDAIEAKKRGEKVAWVSSNFPVEIPETMGIATVYLMVIAFYFGTQNAAGSAKGE